MPTQQNPSKCAASTRNHLRPEALQRSAQHAPATLRVSKRHMKATPKPEPELTVSTLDMPILLKCLEDSASSYDAEFGAYRYDWCGELSEDAQQAIATYLARRGAFQPFLLAVPSYWMVKNDHLILSFDNVGGICHITLIDYETERNAQPKPIARPLFAIEGMGQEVAVAA